MIWWLERAKLITMRYGILAALAALAMAVLPRPGLAGERVTIDTRPGVTQSFMLLEPDSGSVGAVIIFPPHVGQVRFRERKRGGLKISGGGWLGQTAGQYLDAGFTVAVITPPSDQPSGMEENFRQGPAHAQDMAKVIAYLTKRTGRKPFLAGTCRSTYSIAGVASRIDNKTIAGAILASTRTQGRGRYYGPITDGIKSGAVTAPLLFVHHVDDDCDGSPYSLVPDVMNFFRPSAAKVDLVTVKSGWQTALRKQKRGCGDNGSHKFYGSQRATVAAILSWMRSGAAPKTVEAAE